MGPLRVSSALQKAGLVKGSIIIISSQAGSAEWRFTQNPEGGDYGHHMSRAACNIMGVLLAQELKAAGVPVVMLHPGFNRTGMTAKYAEIWDKVRPAFRGAARRRLVDTTCHMPRRATPRHAAPRRATPRHATRSRVPAQEGAVEAAIGAKRVLHEVGGVSMETSGKFINCEDGLQIPW